MDFLESYQVGDAGFESGDSYLQKVEGAVNQTIARAIREATQTADPARQKEAASWLLICCPDIAEQIELPDVEYDRMSFLAAAYVIGDVLGNADP